jgi:hypothetical protein
MKEIATEIIRRMLIHFVIMAIAFGMYWMWA